MRTGRHRDPDVEDARFRTLASWDRFDGEGLDSAAVQCERHLVRFVETLEIPVSISCQANLDVIVAVEPEHVTEHCPTACPERQTFDVIRLGPVGRNEDNATARRARRSPDGQSADLPCRS